jgi:hypothetical protein
MSSPSQTTQKNTKSAKNASATNVVNSYVEDVMNGLKPKPRRKIITKHDAKVCGRKNTKYLEKHYDDFDGLGDLSYYDIELSSQVRGSLHRNLKDKFYN